jgi:CRP/FNR family cyclic AMP-dependent transcriptional regulator
MSMADDIEIVEFQAGEYLFHENEKSFHFFILQEGEVEVFKTKDRVKVPLSVVGPGNALGEFAMIDRNPRSATARAITDGRAAKISEQAYEQLLTELPEWAVVVMRALVTRLRQTNEMVRKHRIIDEDIQRKIESLQFEGGSTIREDNPDLRPPGDADDEGF